MGINAGAFLAPLVCGWLGYEYGWHVGFGAAGVGMLAGLAVFMSGTKLEIFGDNGNQPEEYQNKKMYGLKTDHFFYLIAILMVPISAFLVKNNALEVLDGLQLHSSLLTILGVIILAIIIKKMTELSKMEVFRLVSVLVLTLLITCFLVIFRTCRYSYYLIC